MNNRFFIAALSVLSIVSCSKQEEKRAEGAKALPVLSAEIQNVTAYTEYPVNIQGVINNDVRAKIQGYITQVLVDEGQFVSAGQPLFRLETNMLNQSADASEAGIGAAKASVEAARAAVSSAQVEVDKLRPLVAQNIISSVQLQTAEANLAKAKAQLSQAVAAQHQASANYRSVRANIDYSIIRAPISGVVGSLPFKIGSLVGPNDATPLTTVSDTKQVYAYFSMNEKEYLDFLKDIPGASVQEKLKNIPSVELLLANGQAYSEKGVVQTATGQINPTTGSIQFRVAFPNAQKLISNGSSGRVRIPKLYNDALVIPEASTYEQQGNVIAFKVENDTAKSVILEVENRVNNRIIIKSGLKKGDVIVASGVSTLKTGTAISPKKVSFSSVADSIQAAFKTH